MWKNGLYKITNPKNNLNQNHSTQHRKISLFVRSHKNIVTNDVFNMKKMKNRTSHLFYLFDFYDVTYHLLLSKCHVFCHIFPSVQIYNNTFFHYFYYVLTLIHFTIRPCRPFHLRFCFSSQLIIIRNFEFKCSCLNSSVSWIFSWRWEGIRI